MITVDEDGRSADARQPRVLRGMLAVVVGLQVLLLIWSWSTGDRATPLDVINVVVLALCALLVARQRTTVDGEGVTHVGWRRRHVRWHEMDRIVLQDRRWFRSAPVAIEGVRGRVPVQAFRGHGERPGPFWTVFERHRAAHDVPVVNRRDGRSSPSSRRRTEPAPGDGDHRRSP